MSRSKSTCGTGRYSYRLVSRSEVALTRPALERARYTCEMCPTATDLRVVERRGQTRVLCSVCRLRGWPAPKSEGVASVAPRPPSAYEPKWLPEVRAVEAVDARPPVENHAAAEEETAAAGSGSAP